MGAVATMAAFLTGRSLAVNPPQLDTSGVSWDHKHLTRYEILEQIRFLRRLLDLSWSVPSRRRQHSPCKRDQLDKLVASLPLALSLNCE
jgi:hypothetical protein